MPANINTYIGRLAAWHTLGTVTGKYNTWAEILAYGGLDFDVFKSQLQDSIGRAVDAWGIFRWSRADHDAWKEASGSERQAIKERAEFLGAVGGNYEPIQHTQGFELVDAIMRTAHGAHYETAGVLGKGEVVWGLASLNQRQYIGGNDEIKFYLLFSTSHDGSRAFDFRIVSERVVCENTLDMAMSEKTKAQFKIKHTASAQSRIDDARVVLANLGSDIEKAGDKLNFLAGRKMTRETLTTVMDRLFPKTEKEQSGATVLVSSTRRDNILADVLKLYELNDGNTFPEQRGTAYNLLNAITNYVDHERATKEDGRAESALFGSGGKLKSEALEIITLQASNLPAIGGSLLDKVVSATV